MTTADDLPVERVAIDSLTPHPDNPNRGDVGALDQIIGRLGWWGTIIAQVSTRRILAGEHRWRREREAGSATIPVWWVDVDDATAIEIMLADNKSRDRATTNHDVLAPLLAQLDEAAIIGTGYDPAEVTALLALHGHEPQPIPDPADGSDGDKVRDGVFWPQLSLRVPPDVFERWTQYRIAFDGEPHDALDQLLAEHAELTKAKATNTTKAPRAAKR